jgi:hypothetical protein
MSGLMVAPLLSLEINNMVALLKNSDAWQSEVDQQGIATGLTYSIHPSARVEGSTVTDPGEAFPWRHGEKKRNGKKEAIALPRT